MPFPSLDPALLEALSARGYAEPTAVQAAVLQPEVLGRDLLVSAQTGSGKTVAYGLGAARISSKRTGATEDPVRPACW